MPGNRGHLLTEQPNPHSGGLDSLSIEAAFELMNREDRTVAEAVHQAKASICQAARLVVQALERGGRLIYVGAGTSGRLGVLDAAECPPTFMSNPQQIQGIIAGGDPALRRSIEGAEDDGAAAVQALAERHVTAADVVLGIASGGTTPFVHAAIAEASRRGAKTIFLACVPEQQQPDAADLSIRILTGPEVITGSTRLKAGTATKMVLNMITTISMVQLGKVFGNLMVDLNRAACAKLTDRAIRIVQLATGIDRAEAAALLHTAGDVKTAIVMHHRGVTREIAGTLLSGTAGKLRPIVDHPP